MPSSYRILKNRTLDIREEQEIPVKSHSDIAAVSLTGSQADSLIRIAKEEASKVMADVSALKAQMYAQVMEEATPELEALREAARQEGRDAGYRDGYEHGRREGEARILEEQAGILREARERSAEAFEEAREIVLGAQDRLIRLSVGIAGEIINKSLEIDDNIIRGIVEKALMEVALAQYVTLRVNARSRESLSGHMDSLREIFPGSRITLVTDNLLGDGDCILETPTQIVEATVDAQLVNLREALSEVIRQK